MNLNRITHDVQQGTGPWLRLREQADGTASEASAALGVGLYTSRAELMRAKHTGITEDHGPEALARFRAGHEAEAKARPLAEGFIGEELFPVTMSIKIAGLTLLASMDGLTLDERIAWETKLWNEALAAHVRAGTVPEHYLVQMDQQMLVSGAERCLFTVTDGTPERFVSCWHEASQYRFDALVSGWLQFHKDLAAYVPPVIAEPARAEPMESLPAVSVRLNGALSVVGNLPAFGEALRAFIARMPAKPATDSDFATTEAACKALKKAEEALDAAEAGALASITDVEAMRRAVADCRKLARDTRLAAEKMVERRKTEVKESAVAAARRALDQHIADLNGELAPMRLQPVAADFAGAIKGLRSISSMQDALDTTLANGKIAADAQARVIRGNVATFKGAAEGLEFLFDDLGAIVHKAPDDFAVLVSARITTHRAAEAERERKRAEAEQARVAAEARRLADEAIRQAEAQRVAAERLAAQQAQDAAVRASTLQAAAVVAERLPEAVKAGAIEPAQAERIGGLVASIAASAAVEQARKDEPATLKLCVICERLGVTMTAQFLADVLHVKPARVDGASKLFSESQYQTICRQLQSHVGAMAELYGEVTV